MVDREDIPQVTIPSHDPRFTTHNAQPTNHDSHPCSKTSTSGSART